MKVWVLKTCDTCRKAIKSLRQSGASLEEIDVRADGVDPQDLARFYAEFGEALINRRSTTWRGLSEAARSGDPLALLAAHPTLMKRPVVEEAGQLYLGWAKDVQSALLP
jgi:arsenate reductase-like glutaredoxin family protein